LDAVWDAGPDARDFDAARGIVDDAVDVNPRALDVDVNTRRAADVDFEANPHACSFTYDTTVATADGDIAIGEIEVGDTVLAFNEATGEIAEYEVTAVHVHTDEEILYLIVDGELIVTTPDHPFYTADGEWVAAGELQVGDAVFRADGTSGIVESLEVVRQAQPMYNLTVDEAHTFFVGIGAWLVHNTCPVHENLPGMRPQGLQPGDGRPEISIARIDFTLLQTETPTLWT
jgi:hypothetical protein